MSDEFFRVARMEIKEEISKIEDIFSKCSTDRHIQDNAANIEQHFHKIKGLAPMIGEFNIGKIASIIDSILKHIIKSGTFPDSHLILTESFEKIKILFDKGDKSIEIKDFVISIEKKISDVTTE